MSYTLYMLLSRRDDPVSLATLQLYTLTVQFDDSMCVHWYLNITFDDLLKHIDNALEITRIQPTFVVYEL